MTQQYRTSAIFSCMDCNLEWSDLKTARQSAYEHAKNNDHFVSGEIVTAYHYNEKS